jgi:hypothetical protein
MGWIKERQEEEEYGKPRADKHKKDELPECRRREACC